MIKRLLAALFTLIAATAFAAVDVNKASQADLETIKGIGPGISTKILDERKKGNFKDWPDLVERVKGVGDANASKFSTEGLTVNGQGFKGAAAPAAKPAAKAAAAMPATPATPAMPATPAAKAADAKPAAAAASKADTKAEAKAKAKAEKEEAAAKVKADKDAAKAKKDEAKKAAKADAAASAAKK